MLHLVEAVLDRIELGLVAEMPFAGEVSPVAVLLERIRRSSASDFRRPFWSPGATTTESAERIGIAPGDE